MIPTVVYSPSLARLFVLTTGPEGNPDWYPVWNTAHDIPAQSLPMSAGEMPEDAQQVDGWRPMWAENPLGPGAAGFAWRCVCGMLNSGRWAADVSCIGCRFEVDADSVANQYRTVKVADYDAASSIIGRFRRAVDTIAGWRP